MPTIFAGADHDNVLTLKRNVLVLEELQNAIGRARWKYRAADYEATDIVEVEAIDVLVRRYGVQDARHVEGCRQRQLNQNAVHGRIFVKLGNLGDDLVLLDIARIVEAQRADADIGAGADLVLDIDS